MKTFFQGWHGCSKFWFCVAVLGYLGVNAAWAEPPAPPELEAIMVPFRVGRYDLSIEKATAALAKLGKPDPHILYWRGTAERRLGWLDAAEADFAQLGDFVAWPQYPLASEMAAKMKRMIELRPPHLQDVTVRGKVAFRVYASEDDAFARNIVAGLPKGYEAASAFLKEWAAEVPVYIFNEKDYERFSQFFTLLYGSEPHDWWRLLSTSGTITISQRNRKGEVYPPEVPWISHSITHEMTHVLMGRLVGTVKDLPNWFNEGTADMVAATLTPEATARNDQIMRELADQRGILPLSAITSHASFNANEDELMRGAAQGNPYAQGLNMTRYLGFALKGMKLADFLKVVREKRSFEEALKGSLGIGVGEFYEEWVSEVSRK